MSGILQGLIASLKSAASSAADAYFNLTTLLLNTSSTNGAQNNTFLDSSTNNFTITRNGNTTQGTFTPFSQTGWSTYFSGASGTRLTYPGSSSTYVSGTGDFTIEAWINLDAASAGRSRMLFCSDTANALNVRIGQGNLSSVNGLSVGRNFNSDNENCAFTWAFNTWYHIAIVRSSAVYYFFVNGVQQTTLGSGTSSYSFATATTVAIGDAPSFPNDEIYKGYISNARVSNVARYTSNFTPSTTPLTALSGTQFLSLQNNRWIDNSTNTSTITISGTPSVQAFSPFAPAAEYDAAVVGGSGYFDGTGDSLTWTGTAAGSGAFSYEFWLYSLNDFSANRQPLGVISTSGYNSALDVRMSGTTINMSAYNVANNNFTVPALVANTWYHVVLCRNSSNQATVFLNGVRSSTGAVTLATNFSGLTSCIAAQDSVSAGERVTGYISDIRLIVGSTPYDPTSTTITVPTAPLTAIANTQLLTKFTNTGIFDSTAKNVLETVGNAQVSTTQAKWGTTSMSFSASGNYLTTPYSQNLVFRTGDFTFECWLYWTGGANENNLIMNNASGGLNIKLAATTSTNWALENAYVGQIADFGTAPTKNVWHHIAVTRSSGTLYAFIDGVQVYSGANSTDFTNTATWYIASNGYSSSYYITGFIDDLRITKGYARYTANFTPPAAAFPLQ